MSFDADWDAANAITLTPDVEGNVRCPLCHRTCALPYFVSGHIDHHRYSIDGRQLAEIDVAVQVIVRDRFKQQTVTTGTSPSDPQETP